MFYLEDYACKWIMSSILNSFMSREVVANYIKLHHTSVKKNNVQFNYNFPKIKVVSAYVCVISVGELR